MSNIGHINPLLAREIRARFRDDRAFGLLFLLACGLSLFFAFLYGEVVTTNPTARGIALSGQTIFAQLSWMQTLGWLLISPALTSSSIAYERERGWFDSLLLSPLTPRAIVLGKWLSALVFGAILTLVTLPLLSLVFLLGGVTPLQFGMMALLHAACAMCGASVGIATSAWSPRANTALRTAYGFIFIGFVASFYGAMAAGELPFATPGFPSLTTNAFWTFLGRTNPVLRSVEISGNLGFQHLGTCLFFLAALTVFFLWAATLYARRPLQEAPFVQKSTKNKEKTRTTHAEIPLVTRLHFANPVLDREVRSKFRMRQPPIAVIVVEVLLGILVAFFYARTLYWAFFEPMYREIIWWGLIFTGLLVTMMAAALMGSNGIAREREGGTWESVRLSLLLPHEIVRGKVGASLLTCALFSLPVWPLLLPCIAWGAPTTSLNLITRSDLLSCLAIWIATAWSYTLIGLWLGRKAPRTSRASGKVLGTLSAYLLLSPFVLSIYGDNWTETILSMTHPFVALVDVGGSQGNPYGTALFCLFQGVVGLVVWLALHRAIAQEIAQAGE